MVCGSEAMYSPSGPEPDARIIDATSMDGGPPSLDEEAPPQRMTGVDLKGIIGAAPSGDEGPNPTVPLQTPQQLLDMDAAEAAPTIPVSGISDEEIRIFSSNKQKGSRRSGKKVTGLRSSDDSIAPTTPMRSPVEMLNAAFERSQGKKKKGEDLSTVEQPGLAADIIQRATASAPSLSSLSSLPPDLAKKEPKGEIARTLSLDRPVVPSASSMPQSAEIVTPPPQKALFTPDEDKIPTRSVEGLSNREVTRYARELYTEEVPFEPNEPMTIPPKEDTPLPGDNDPTRGFKGLQQPPTPKPTAAPSKPKPAAQPLRPAPQPAPTLRPAEPTPPPVHAPQPAPKPKPAPSIAPVQSVANGPETGLAVGLSKDASWAGQPGLSVDAEPGLDLHDTHRTGEPASFDGHSLGSVGPASGPGIGPSLGTGEPSGPSMGIGGGPQSGGFGMGPGAPQGPSAGPAGPGGSVGAQVAPSLKDGGQFDEEMPQRSRRRQRTAGGVVLVGLVFVIVFATILGGLLIFKYVQGQSEEDKAAVESPKDDAQDPKEPARHERFGFEAVIEKSPFEVQDTNLKVKPGKGDTSSVTLTGKIKNAGDTALDDATLKGTIGVLTSEDKTQTHKLILKSLKPRVSRKRTWQPGKDVAFTLSASDVPTSAVTGEAKDRFFWLVLEASNGKTFNFKGTIAELPLQH